MVDVIAKATNDLHPTDILFQTPYWAQVKSQMGMAPMAFDILSSETWGDVLVLIKDHCGHKLALVPQRFVRLSPERRGIPLNPERRGSVPRAWRMKSALRQYRRGVNKGR